LGVRCSIPWHPSAVIIGAHQSAGYFIKDVRFSAWPDA
jgi:hypothetical protein